MSSCSNIKECIAIHYSKKKRQQLELLIDFCWQSCLLQWNFYVKHGNVMSMPPCVRIGLTLLFLTRFFIQGLCTGGQNLRCMCWKLKESEVVCFYRRTYKILQVSCFFSQTNIEHNNSKLLRNHICSASCSRSFQNLYSFFEIFERCNF